MQFQLTKQQLEIPLSLISGAVEKRSTHPILSNVLLHVSDNRLIATATDTELELVGTIDNVTVKEPGKVTVLAQKLLSVCRALPDDAPINFFLNENQHIEIKSNNVRFSLATLPATTFPNFEADDKQFDCTIDAQALKTLIERTQFSMGVQDVRFYLNGLLLELTPDYMRCVSSDGHRISMATFAFETPLENIQNKKIIIPSKGVYELQKLLAMHEGEVSMSCHANSLQVDFPQYRFSTKLLEGQYPDYNQVFGVNYDKHCTANVQDLKAALSRVSILCNDRYRTIVLILKKGEMEVHAHNPSQEESHDQISIEYDGEESELGFNVDYLLDILGVLKTDTVCFSFISHKKSVLLEGTGESEHYRYMVMPRSI